jgi:hypothetical protein
MRKIRQLCAAAFLTIALTISALAGDIQLPGVTNPPPDKQQTSATGDMQTPSASAAGQMETPLVPDTESVAEIALTLLVDALSIF